MLTKRDKLNSENQWSSPRRGEGEDLGIKLQSNE